MRLLCVVFLALALTGCRFDRAEIVPVEQRVPVIDEPQRPQLELLAEPELAAYKALPDGLRVKLETNDRKLKVYAEQLLAGIREYNGYSRLRNQTSNERVGVKTGTKERQP